MTIREEKPSRNEDEYFVKLDAELIKARRAKLDEERKKQERSAHYMKCPKCGADLVEREMNHVKVDQCTECEGIWLDKGEIELLVHTEEASGVSRVIRDLLGVRFR
jgi:ribosomal protein L37AE/L43A